ncbi:hypothetical protein Avbf_11525 [Armadillidium vulgare]|nr:hypothetical protein Avbf_11525 [Armadillidium vulgare]
MWYSAKHMVKIPTKITWIDTFSDYDNYNPNADIYIIILNMLCNKIMTLSPELLLYLRNETRRE